MFNSTAINGEQNCRGTRELNLSSNLIGFGVTAKSKVIKLKMVGQFAIKTVEIFTHGLLLLAIALNCSCRTKN